ncbi:hypothetical protein D3C71_2178350 [compost metagenome]
MLAGILHQCLDAHFGNAAIQHGGVNINVVGEPALKAEFFNLQIHFNKRYFFLDGNQIVLPA